jgi:hypothetical protein
MSKRPRIDSEEHLLDLAKAGDWEKLDTALKLSPKFEDAVARKVFEACVATMARNNEQFDKHRAEFIDQLRRGSRADVADGAASAASQPRSASPLYVAAGGGAAVAYRRQSPRRSEQIIVRDGEYIAPSWLNL